MTEPTWIHRPLPGQMDVFDVLADIEQETKETTMTDRPIKASDVQLHPPTAQEVAKQAADRAVRRQALIRAGVIAADGGDISTSERRNLKAQQEQMARFRARRAKKAAKG